MKKTMMELKLLFLYLLLSLLVLGVGCAADENTPIIVPPDSTEQDLIFVEESYGALEEASEEIAERKQVDAKTCLDAGEIVGSLAPKTERYYRDMGSSGSPNDALLLVVDVGCALDEKVTSALPEIEQETTADNTTAEKKEADNFDQTEMMKVETEVCLAEGETVNSLALKTDLFSKGMTITYAKGGVEFKVVDSSYALVLSDDYTATTFSADSEDTTKLVAEGDKKTAVKDVADFKFHLNADFELTVADLKKYFAEEGFNLDSDDAHKAVFSYEFAKFFEDAEGAFKLYVNDKVFYASEDKSKLSFEFGESWSSLLEEAVLADSKEEETIDTTTEEGSEGETADEETAEEETGFDEAEETAEESITEGSGVQSYFTLIGPSFFGVTETAEENSDVKFTFSVTVFYEVSAEELADNEYFKKFSAACEAIYY